jgi:3-hydroxyisobutyrate dehydrogenase
MTKVAFIGLGRMGHGMAGRSGASFTAALRHKDAAYAVKLAETLLAEAPLFGRAAVEAYARANAEMPDDDEGRMIEIVSRPK